MTPAEVTTILRQFNEWRRLEDDALPYSEVEIGEAIDAAVEMIDRLEAAEKERDNANAAAVNIALEAERLQCENDTLRVKIEASEQQEPVAWLHETRRDSDVVTDAVKHVWGKAAVGSMAAYSIPLYALPGTRPAPSVPEDVMRDAERYRYLRARDDETAGVGCWLEANGRVCDRGWLYGDQLDSAIDTCIEMLAAAPEAKP